MFTYHCWVEIENTVVLERHFTGEIDYPEYRKNLLEISEQLKYLVEHQFDIKKRDLRVIDGSGGLVSIHFSGQQNHYSFGPEDILNWIKIHAPGSHGLLYTLNGELEINDETYIVFKLKDNKVTKLIDPFSLKN